MKKIKTFISFMYYKWIKRRCPHVCLFCAFKNRECFEEFKTDKTKW